MDNRGDANIERQGYASDQVGLQGLAGAALWIALIVGAVGAVLGWAS